MDYLAPKDRQMLASTAHFVRAEAKGIGKYWKCTTLRLCQGMFLKGSHPVYRAPNIRMDVNIFTKDLNPTYLNYAMNRMRAAKELKIEDAFGFQLGMVRFRMPVSNRIKELFTISHHLTSLSFPYDLLMAENCAPDIEVLKDVSFGTW